MCNLYNLTTSQDAIRQIARAMHDRVGNIPTYPAIYPDYTAPVVRNGEDGMREMALARWGMPSPAFTLKGSNSDPGVTNVRNTSGPHWRRWLNRKNRCLVPVTGFSEPERGPDGKSQPVWFALGDNRPLAFFAGIECREWRCVRKVNEGETTNDLYALLTCEPNAEVAPCTPRPCR